MFISTSGRLKILELEAKVLPVSKKSTYHVDDEWFFLQKLKKNKSSR